VTITPGFGQDFGLGVVTALAGVIALAWAVVRCVDLIRLIGGGGVNDVRDDVD
jgi:hypothetical protein